MAPVQETAMAPVRETAMVQEQALALATPLTRSASMWRQSHRRRHRRT